jgi:CDP-6-deoxy-D-xylo-4-hexulose-3-dehydrase
MNDLDSLLHNISSYIKSKNYNKKEWQPGTSIQYSGPFFDEEEYLAGIKSLLEGWLVLGDSGMKFERKFPRLFEKEYGVLVNSGSSANLLMMAYLTSKRSYNLQKGTKVLTPVAGFPTTVNPILNFGFEPIFVDIEIDTLNLNLDHVENTLAKNKDIRAITFAHVLGNPPNMNRLMELVKKYNLILLEDCCDALGSTYDGKPLGSFGEMASCSFYPAHHMTMGEGGFIACNTYEQETILRSFREWGRGCYCTGPKANTLKCGTCKKRFSNWIPALPNEIFDHKYIYDEIGYNLKPIELQAAIGLVQLKKLDTIHSLRRRNYKLLFNIYSKYEEFFHLPKSQELSDPSWFAFPLTLKKNAPFTRADIINFLEDNLIQTRPYFAGNILLQPAYSDIMNLTDIKNNFPVAVKVTTDTFFHGTSPVITPEQIDFIGEKVMQFMSKY